MAPFVGPTLGALVSALRSAAPGPFYLGQPAPQAEIARHGDGFVVTALSGGVAGVSREHDRPADRGAVLCNCANLDGLVFELVRRWAWGPLLAIDERLRVQPLADGPRRRLARRLQWPVLGLGLPPAQLDELLRGARPLNPTEARRLARTRAARDLSLTFAITRATLRHEVVLHALGPEPPNRQLIQDAARAADVAPPRVRAWLTGPLPAALAVVDELAADYLRRTVASFGARAEVRCVDVGDERPC